MSTQSSRLEDQLENRRKNLAVIQETIQRDASSGHKLFAVRDFLARRVQELEHELNETKTVAN